MPHFPKPFFRASRGLWYLQVDGKQINLGPEREAAFQLYHEIMGQPRPVAVAGNAVIVILDLFLDWTRTNRSPGSYGWYLEHLTHFARTLPEGLTVDAIRPFHVQQYLDSKTTWSSSTKRGAVIAIKRAFNWAEKMGHTDRNPLRHVEKPEAGRREQVISLQEHQRILGMVRDQEFCDLLTAAWETGARPQELFRVEARHVDLKNGRWIFPKQESKGKRYSRAVYLNDRMVEITRRLMLKRPDGPLFRNADGRPWTALAVNNRFARIRAWMGRLVMKEQRVKLDENAVTDFAKKICPERQTAHGPVRKSAAEIKWEARGKLLRRCANQYAPKYCLYTWRHSFATRLLEAGIDAMIVATLLGHVDTTMLGKVYSHVAHNPAFMREVIQKAAS